MAIARWTPFDELTNLHTTMDRLFGDLFDSGQGAQERSGSGSMTFRLPVDISENESSYTIKAPVAGFNPQDVELTVTGNVLSIRATRRQEREEKKDNYLRREMVYGDFVRQIALPEDAQADKINASFNNGVLQVEIPRKPRQQPKRIEVRSEGQSQPKQQNQQGQQNQPQKQNENQNQMAGTQSSR